MTTEFPLGEAPATPEYALEILQFASAHFPFDDLQNLDTSARKSALSEWLDFDASVGELDGFLDDSGQQLAQSLNSLLGIDIPIANWKPILNPMRLRTVRDVCEFAATRIGARPIIRPWKFVAGECLPAGAFLTIRSLLANEGNDPASVKPSSPVAPFVREHNRWLRLLHQAAPTARCPPFSHIYRPLWVRVLATLALFAGLLPIVLGIVLMILALTEKQLLFAGVMAGIIAAGIVGIWWAGRVLEPIGINFKEPFTFRDLSYVLAGQRPRQRVRSAS